MRLGLIARPDSRGLGIQCLGFHRAMQPDKVMVVDCPSDKPLPIRKDWYPGATWIKGKPDARDFRRWLDGLDVVYTAETSYGKRGPEFWDEAERAGVRTVLHANFEFLNRNDRPAVWAAPSLWRFNDFPSGAVHLPVPVELDRFRPRRPEITPHFLHLIGRPATVKLPGGEVERQGTVDLLKALRFVREDITVTIRCQEPGYVNTLIGQHRIHTPKNVILRVESGDVENYWDLYQEGDIMVLPRRWGGLSLPTNEAIAAGMPVLMPDISPNSTWLPKPWLFPAEHAGSFQAKQRIDYYRTNPEVLSAKLDEYARLKPSTWAADIQRLQHQLSWETLKETYMEVLSGV